MKEHIRYSLQKSERLKSRKAIQQVFNEGSHFHSFPVKTTYLSVSGSAILQAGFSVSRRHFKKAVDRNRIKRLMREAYRLQKHPLETALKSTQHSLAVFFVFSGKETADFEMIYRCIGKAINKLIQVTNELAQ